MKLMTMLVGLSVAMPISAQPTVESDPGPFSNLALDCDEADTEDHGNIRGVCDGSFFLIKYRVVPEIEWLNNEKFIEAIRGVIDKSRSVPPDFLRGIELLVPEVSYVGEDQPGTFGLPGQAGFCQIGELERPETEEWLVPSSRDYNPYGVNPVSREKTSHVSACRCFISINFEKTMIVDFFPKFDAPHNNSDMTIIQSYMASISLNR